MLDSALFEVSNTSYMIDIGQTTSTFVAHDRMIQIKYFVEKYQAFTVFLIDDSAKRRSDLILGIFYRDSLRAKIFKTLITRRHLGLKLKIRAL